MNDKEPATKTQIKKLYAVLHALGISPIMFKNTNSIERIVRLTRRQISDWIVTLELQEQENKQRESISPSGLRRREELKEIMQESLEDAEEIVNKCAAKKNGFVQGIPIVKAQIAIALFNQKVKDEIE